MNQENNEMNQESKLCNKAGFIILLNDDECDDADNFITGELESSDENFIDSKSTLEPKFENDTYNESEHVEQPTIVDDLQMMSNTAIHKESQNDHYFPRI